MIIDGGKIAEEIKGELKEKTAESGQRLRLAIVQVGKDEISKKFIERKKAFAQDIGVDVKIYNISSDISTDKLRKKMAEICHGKKNSGVMVQLPLPVHIKTQYILDSVPVGKDVDVLSSHAFGKFVSGKSKIIPPVAGVIQTIFEKYGINPEGKNVVVVGKSMLIGRPAAIWCMAQGATVSVLNSKTPDISKFIKDADILITGTGKPGLITADMIKKGSVIIDMGTGLKDGKLAGDVSPRAAEFSGFFTPVPGGTGPVTVAMLFTNLLAL